MHRKHPKIRYVGGLASLILLPALLFVSLTGIMQKARYSGSIQIDMISGGFYDPVAKSTPDSTYMFVGSTEASQLDNFRAFCEQYRVVSKRDLILHLPKKCSYDFFIHVVDILQNNHFMAHLFNRTIEFRYNPWVTFQQEYERLSLAEEMQNIFSELSKRISSIIEQYFGEDVVYTVRIFKYSNLGPVPLMGDPGTAFFTPKDKIKEPQSKILFDATIGLWFIPIILCWAVLLIISVRRSRGIPDA